MTKFETKKSSFEFRFSRRNPPPAMSEKEIADMFFSSCYDAETVAEFDSKEEAVKAFEENKHLSSTYLSEGWANALLVCGTIVWMEENTYDEDGEFDQGGDVWCIAAEAYEPPIDNREAEEIASILRESNEWNPDLLRDLCVLADMEDEWDEADGESFEAVAYAAADALGVEI